MPMLYTFEFSHVTRSKDMYVHLKKNKFVRLLKKKDILITSDSRPVVNTPNLAWRI